MNNANIMGRICNDIELRRTESGKSVTKFTVAVPDKFNKEKTNFINCIAWGGTAEFIEKWFTKGQLIAVSGAIQTGEYEKNGIKHKTFEINISDTSFCGDKKEKAETFKNGSLEDSNVSVFEDTEEELPF